MKIPLSIARFQRSLSLVACGVLMTTAQAWGFDERHKKMDWEGSLNLTEEQQQRIDAIEDKYRDRFREVKPSEAADESRRSTRQDLYLQMREEIRSVLSDEQQAIAEEQVRKRESEGREQHLDRLARKLNLTAGQREELEEKLSTCKEEEWPVSMRTREQDRKDFEMAVKSVLTDDQKEAWSDMRRKEREKWRHHDMERLKREGKGADQ